MISTTLAENDLDSVKVDPAHHKVLFENDQVRVLRWFVAAGDTTLHHSHPNNLNICLTGYNGKVAEPNAKISKVQAKAGSVTWRQTGSHAVENLTNQPMESIIVEPKEPASTRPAGSPDPVAVDASTTKSSLKMSRCVCSGSTASQEIYLCMDIRIAYKCS